jgi:hypothetical protein
MVDHQRRQERRAISEGLLMIRGMIATSKVRVSTVMWRQMKRISTALQRQTKSKTRHLLNQIAAEIIRRSNISRTHHSGNFSRRSVG